MTAFAIGLAFGAAAMAQEMSKDDYKAGQEKLAAEYMAARAACDSLSGTANEICQVDATGRAKVARAELDAAYTPSAKSRHEARVVKAEADRASALERCNDAAGNAKEVCRKEADAAATSAKADAKVQIKTTDANAARGASAGARARADAQAAEARTEATEDKLDARHGVARQQCDRFAGDAKDACLNQAKARFAKP
ncbi:hypothetical protein [Piscinibacter sp. XHJ-5]|uniref:hypothetical protein n=1 Tax=Piscinibacter sp. XHJ-5 TaxID=3037797 RepID=UPI00245325A3|nr:hypothetical protein [Piscinibacter sp. XHJ-5]